LDCLELVAACMNISNSSGKANKQTSKQARGVGVRTSHLWEHLEGACISNLLDRSIQIARFETIILPTSQGHEQNGNVCFAVSSISLFQDRTTQYIHPVLQRALHPSSIRSIGRSVFRKLFRRRQRVELWIITYLYFPASKQRVRLRHICSNRVQRHSCSHLVLSRSYRKLTPNTTIFQGFSLQSQSDQTALAIRGAVNQSSNIQRLEWAGLGWAGLACSRHNLLSE